jgi:hypothetical protein
LPNRAVSLLGTKLPLMEPVALIVIGGEPQYVLRVPQKP